MRAKTSTRNSEISITDTILKDAKRSDFVRNRDMEGDIEIYGQDAPKPNIMLKFQVNNYDLKSIIMNHLPLNISFNNAYAFNSF